jgi:hypothetical protein
VSTEQGCAQLRVSPLHAGVAVFVQSMHSAPPGGPHALSCVPSTHVLPTQHPVVHVIEHDAGWQTPA